jgi:hypothetical protein
MTQVQHPAHSSWIKTPQVQYSSQQEINTPAEPCTQQLKIDPAGAKTTTQQLETDI